MEYESRRDADDAYHEMHNKRIGRDDLLKIEVSYHRQSRRSKLTCLSGLALLPLLPGASIPVLARAVQTAAQSAAANVLPAVSAPHAAAVAADHPHPVATTPHETETTTAATVMMATAVNESSHPAKTTAVSVTMTVATAIGLAAPKIVIAR